MAVLYKVLGEIKVTKYGSFSSWICTKIRHELYLHRGARRSGFVQGTATLPTMDRVLDLQT